MRHVSKNNIHDKKNIWIDDNMFSKLLDNVKVHNEKKLKNFEWLSSDYHYDPKEVSENGFYFSVVAKHLVLHGLENHFWTKNWLKELNWGLKKYSYLFFMHSSYNDSRKAKAVMDAGLGVLKFSLDAMEEKKYKKSEVKEQISKECEKIMELIDYKKIISKLYWCPA